MLIVTNLQHADASLENQVFQLTVEINYIRGLERMNSSTENLI